MSERVEGWVLAFCRAHPHGPPEPIGGRGTRSDGLTQAEAGGLLSRCEDIEANLLMWMHGFDRMRRASFYAILHEAQRQRRTLRRAYCQIDSEDELRDLAALVLEEVRLAPHQRTTAYRACWMAVSHGAWKRRYDRAHRALAGRVGEWIGNAERAIRRNLLSA